MTKGLFKSNNMVKKLVEISGIGYSLQFYDGNGNTTESISQYAEKEGLKLKVDDKEYSNRELADVFFDLPGSLQDIVEKFQDGKDLYIKEFCDEKGASSVAKSKKSGTTTIEIEIPEDDKFDPQKAAIVTAAWLYPDGTIGHMVVGLFYEDKVYPLYPGEVDTTGCEMTCIYNADKTASGVEYTNETATDEQLADAAKLPLLVFRYQTLSYCFSPGDEFDEEEFSDLEGPGVVSAINDEGNGTMFVCADSLEYINSGEMTEILMEEGITKYEITLSATEKRYVLLNADSKPDEANVLKTIAAIWEPSNENCNYNPVFDKLLFRAISRDPEDCAQNYDYLLDNGKIYELPEGKFDEIIASLSEEDQELNRGITPFDEYEQD